VVSGRSPSTTRSSRTTQRFGDQRYCKTHKPLRAEETPQGFSVALCLLAFRYLLLAQERIGYMPPKRVQAA